MHVVLYAVNFAPELTGCGKYTGEMAMWLAKRGHRVQVVTAPPYYPEWRVAAGYSGWRFRRDRVPVPGVAEGVAVTRAPLWVPARVSGTTRVLHLASFALTSAPPLFAKLTTKPDLLVLVLPTLACAPLALALARACGVRTWAHVQDFEIEAAFRLGLVNDGAARRLAVQAESALLRAFGRVSTITPRMLERLHAIGVPPDRTVLFPNWVDLTTVFPLPGPNAFRVELGIGRDDILLLYAGNMGEKQGLELLVECAHRLRDESALKFVFVGDGSARERLQSQTAGLGNVRWLPLQPVERLNLMLNAADVHLLPQRADVADLVMPSKLAGMLASGRPVLGTASAGTQLGELLEEVGRRVDPGNIEALTFSLCELASHPGLREELGTLGRRYAEAHLNIDSIMASFLRDAEAYCGIRHDAAVRHRNA